MVCGLFSVFWLSFGMLNLPSLGLAEPYSASGGAASKEYNAVVALYLIVWGFALLTFFIFTLKTNVVFAGIFLFVTLAAFVLSGAYWKVSQGDYAKAGDLQKVSFSVAHPRPYPSRLFLILDRFSVTSREVLVRPICFLLTCGADW